MNRAEEQFLFTGKTVGLPDHFYLDDKGKIQAGLLGERVLLMSRQRRKMAGKDMARRAKAPDFALTGKKQPLIDYYADTGFRQRSFWGQFDKYFEKITGDDFDFQVWAGNFSAPSLELVIFHEQAQDILADPDKGLTPAWQDEEDSNLEEMEELWQAAKG